MINDDTRPTEVVDLEKTRKQRRLTDIFRHLLDGARAGKMRSFASRVYYKDNTSELVVAGGTPEEQAAVRAKLEVMEAEVEALMAECRPIAGKLFAHLQREERLRVFDSPERMRLGIASTTGDRWIDGAGLIGIELRAPMKLFHKAASQLL